MTEGWRVMDAGVERAAFDVLLGEVLFRHMGPGRVQVRITPGAEAENVFGTLHGGYLAAVAEQTMFLPLYLDGRIARAGVLTIDFSLRYLAGGVMRAALEMELEVLHETGRLAFVRGTMRQKGEILLAYESTMRKVRSATP